MRNGNIIAINIHQIITDQDGETRYSINGLLHSEFRFFQGEELGFEYEHIPPLPELPESVYLAIARSHTNPHHIAPDPPDSHHDTTPPHPRFAMMETQPSQPEEDRPHKIHPIDHQ